jgi:hypothetical protein
MKIQQIIKIQKFYKHRYFSKICLPILLNYYFKKITVEEFYNQSIKLKIFKNKCLHCNSYYMTHTIFICLNCYKRRCFDCSDSFDECCFGTTVNFHNDGTHTLYYSLLKKIKTRKIQLWYKKIYFRNITIPKLWIMYENAIKIKYHPDNFANFDPTNED